MNEDDPMSSDKRQTSQRQMISRRKLLTTIPATAGFASAGVVASPTDRNSSVEIVTTRKGDNTPHQTAKVPKKWLQHEKQARKEVEQLKVRYLDKNWVKGVGIGRSKASVAGMPASVLQIKINKKAEQKIPTRGAQNLPLSNSSGIPIETHRVSDAGLAMETCVPALLNRGAATG
jgi:hypothetical protein